MRSLVKSAAAAAILALFSTGCATSPFGQAGASARDLGPAQALRQPGRIGETVLWGGRIVGVVNTGEATELEILALPLGPGDRPRRNAEGGARFVIRQAGFLEPMTFAPGRHVTALGEFSGIESRSVGAFPLDHPVLEVRQIELWPVEPNSAYGNVHFGIGVRL
mgnify:CR=1 FL=1